MDQMTYTETAASQVLRHRAVLADMAVSSWAGDKHWTDGPEEPLKKAQDAWTAMKNQHVNLTLPWSRDPGAKRVASGLRLLPQALHPVYRRTINELYAVAKEKRDIFLEKMRATGRIPTDDITGSFRLFTDMLPFSIDAYIPMEGGITPESAEVMTERNRDRLEFALERALAFAFVEATERIQRLTNRLVAKPTNTGRAPVFHTSTLTAVQEVVWLLRGWNLRDEAKFTELSDAIALAVDGITIEELRSSNDVRVKMNALLDKALALVMETRGEPIE